MNRNVEIKTTTNSRVYKHLTARDKSGCPICAPHRGCNRMQRCLDNTWKKHKNKQWE